MKKILLLILLTSTTALATVEKKLEYDRVEIVDGYCQIRQATVILDNKKEIARTFHRWAVEPNGDLTQFPKYVRDICKAAWTAEVVEKHRLMQIKNKILLGEK